MDPTNRSETSSAMTLSRVQQNDPALGILVVSNGVRSTDEGICYYWPNDSADLARLGDAVGNNTNLRILHIRSACALFDMAANNGAFFEGLNRNASINELGLMDCNLLGGMGRQILNGFVANDTNLTSIALHQCAIGNGGAAVIASAVLSCTNLINIRLSSCNIDDDILEDFVSGIRGLHQLLTLSFEGNNIGRAGWEALATLLQDPHGNLTWLDLAGNNRIDDECAKILANSLKANSLKGNSKLQYLVLSGSAITESGWDVFSRVLCNTSSVNATYLSNHTLLILGNAARPTNISSLLELNRGANNKEVAIQKILRHHTHLDMEPFLEWDLKVLPLAVSWFDKARGDAQNDESNVDAKKLSAIYQFARALPMMFVAPPSKATNKRKIGEVN